MRYDLTDNMTEEMIGRNHHKEKKKIFTQLGLEISKKSQKPLFTSIRNRLHKYDEVVKSQKSFKIVIPAPYQVRDKLQLESSHLK
jgi:hypothetical protein